MVDIIRLISVCRIKPCNLSELPSVEKSLMQGRRVYTSDGVPLSVKRTKRTFDIKVGDFDSRGCSSKVCISSYNCIGVHVV